MSRLSDWTRARVHTSPPSATPSTLALSWVPEWINPLSLLIREHFSHGHTLASWAQLFQARVSPGGHIQWMLVRLFLLSPCGLDSLSCLPSPACIFPPSSKWRLDLPVPRLRADLKATFSPGFAREGGEEERWVLWGLGGAEGTEVRAVQAVLPHPGGGS